VSGARDIIRRQRRNKRRSPARRPRWLIAAWVVVAATAFTGTAFAARGFVLTRWMRVQTLAVRGAQRLTAGDLRVVMADALGQPILLLDLERQRKRLEHSPGIREARVARRLPDGLEAVIVERRAVARAVIGGREQLLDEEGFIFPALRAQPGDAQLPVVRGLITPPGELRLFPLDRPGVEALVVLTRAMGGPPPEGTSVDLTPKDRIVLRPGRNAPPLWLDRSQPGRNLRNLLAWQDRAPDLAPGAAVDLRFAHRLTLAPPPQDASGVATE
jgi:hypothetical protein